MILESWPWKQDLLRRKSLLIRYNTSDHLLENEERAYTTIEKAIFYSAFIIKDNRVYCTNSNKLKTKFYIDDNEYYINKNSEVRKCSKTKNKTWLVEVI